MQPRKIQLFAGRNVFFYNCIWDIKLVVESGLVRSMCYFGVFKWINNDRLYIFAPDFSTFKNVFKSIFVFLLHLKTQNIKILKIWT